MDEADIARRKKIIAQQQEMQKISVKDPITEMDKDTEMYQRELEKKSRSNFFFKFYIKNPCKFACCGILFQILVGIFAI
jgi:hypothetical protein